MFYKIHKVDVVRLLGGNLGMLPRFKIFETRETDEDVEISEEPISKRKKKVEMKNERRFVVDGKLEQKSAGF